MTNQTIIPTPLQLGHFLQRRGVRLSVWPDVQYRGIDRLPYVPSLEEEQILQATGQGELVQLWTSYWDALESGELSASLAIAQCFQHAFRTHGYDFELVYAQILEIPAHLDDYPHGRLWLRDLELAADHLIRVHEQIDRSLSNLALLGVDISHPTIMFHSAIFQPGLNRRVPDLPGYLNDHGLFPNFENARPLIDDANAMDYGAFPFCGIEISHVISRDE
jgi:hypothetical protein